MSLSTRPDSLHLVLGDEELLVERAVASVVRAVRAAAGPAGEDIPVSRLRTGDASAPELAELLSPSLFAEDRVIVLGAAAEAGKDAVTLVQDAAADLPEGVVLIVLHSGAGRAKAMAGVLQKSGATVHQCAKLKPSERVDFVRGEFRAAGVRVGTEVLEAVVEAVGSDLRELASACSQLVADTGGKIDAAAVQRYYSGRAEVSGFDVADKAVAGDSRGALEALRWAMHRGVAHVLLADALADAVHTIARVGSAGRGDPFRMASELGMPPWKIKKAQAQARGWNPASIGEALQVVAKLNADVKGQAADADYALEWAVQKVADLYGGG
ncbi:DNA polymerase III subunit delta [Rhodococcus xishaensis]|uniref:DNA-directed DNA polymerase n=1 Tax=Rhodococcus xishaensis TaxID=2487364 RepID=A0A3S3APQ3_9NOCA|nr:DNA polymerase III subunit delta [Rhodococcus xishaensis]RVW05527.1 DNA polymerase III subunit delta [Rhodococcus xishaensis]